jgi:hypothetical protein
VEGGRGRETTQDAQEIVRIVEVYGLPEPGPVVLLTTARKGQVDVMAMSRHTMLEFEPPTVEIAEAAASCGNCSGRTVDKFARFGLTALPASRVSAPRVAECYANLECRVIEAMDPEADAVLHRGAYYRETEAPGPGPEPRHQWETGSWRRRNPTVASIA